MSEAGVPRPPSIRSGASVVDRAHEHAGPSHRGLAVGAAGDPEVGQVDVLVVLAVVAAGDQHVGGLDVAVHEAAAVGGGERGGDGAQQLDRAPGLEPAPVLDQRGAGRSRRPSA